MIKTSVTPKQRNRLDALNKAVRRLYGRYVIAPSGVIIPKDHLKPVQSGVHFSKVDDMSEIAPLLLAPGSAVQIDADALFTHVRDSKKTIKELYRNEDDIGFKDVEATEDDLMEFASVVSTSKEFARDLANVEAILTLLETAESVELTDDDVALLQDDEMLVVASGDYRVRTTKELFPYIRTKNLDYTVFFYDADEFAFVMTIHYQNGDIHNFHQYKCIKSKKK